MEDSGIDSEDKISFVGDIQVFGESKKMLVDDNKVFTESPEDELNVTFRGVDALGRTKDDTHKKNQEDTISNIFSAVSPVEGKHHHQPPNTCRILQRKLELKVERAKRNYNKCQEDCAKKSQSSNLIPISRLQIPGYSENQRLVDYKSDNSDEPEEISFFPVKLKNSKKQQHQELSDTFSIQEMTIESDIDSDDSAGSQNLELLPPRSKTNFLDTIVRCLCCTRLRSRAT